MPSVCGWNFLVCGSWRLLWMRCGTVSSHLGCNRMLGLHPGAVFKRRGNGMRKLPCRDVFDDASRHKQYGMPWLPRWNCLLIDGCIDIRDMRKLLCGHLCRSCIDCLHELLGRIISKCEELSQLFIMQQWTIFRCGSDCMRHVP